MRETLPVCEAGIQILFRGADLSAAGPELLLE